MPSRSWLLMALPLLALSARAVPTPILSRSASVAWSVSASRGVGVEARAPVGLDRSTRSAAFRCLPDTCPCAGAVQLRDLGRTGVCRGAITRVDAGCSCERSADPQPRIASR